MTRGGKKRYNVTWTVLTIFMHHHVADLKSHIGYNFGVFWEFKEARIITAIVSDNFITGTVAPSPQQICFFKSSRWHSQSVWSVAAALRSVVHTHWLRLRCEKAKTVYFMSTFPEVFFFGGAKRLQSVTCSRSSSPLSHTPRLRGEGPPVRP